MEALVKSFDAQLVNLAHTLGNRYTQVWGTPNNLRDKAEVEALLNVDVAATGKMFAAHAAQVQALVASGVATFEPWETVTPYTYQLTDEEITLGEDLAEEWQPA